MSPFLCTIWRLDFVDTYSRHTDTQTDNNTDKNKQQQQNSISFITDPILTRL